MTKAIEHTCVTTLCEYTMMRRHLGVEVNMSFDSGHIATSAESADPIIIIIIFFFCSEIGVDCTYSQGLGSRGNDYEDFSFPQRQLFLFYLFIYFKSS